MRGGTRQGRLVASGASSVARGRPPNRACCSIRLSAVGGKGVAMTDDIHKAELAIEASESSLLEAAAHIERAAEKNDDPAVAKELHDAALAADTTAARVGWLRATLTRLFRRQSA